MPVSGQSKDESNLSEMNEVTAHKVPKFHATAMQDSFGRDVTDQ
jgi:hypothetical protein